MNFLTLVGKPVPNAQASLRTTFSNGATLASNHELLRPAMQGDTVSATVARLPESLGAASMQSGFNAESNQHEASFAVTYRNKELHLEGRAPYPFDLGYKGYDVTMTPRNTSAASH